MARLHNVRESKDRGRAHGRFFRVGCSLQNGLHLSFAPGGVEFQCGQYGDLNAGIVVGQQRQCWRGILAESFAKGLDLFAVPEVTVGGRPLLARNS